MESYMRHGGAHFVGFYLVAFIAGCGSGSRHDLLPVGGTVTMDGEPLAGVILEFRPTGETRGVGAGGYTDEAGKYELFARQGKGATVGKYRVTALKYVLPDGSDFPIDSGRGPIESGARQMLPFQYSDRDATELTAEVSDDAPNRIDFQLSSQP